MLFITGGERGLQLCRDLFMCAEVPGYVTVKDEAEELQLLEPDVVCLNNGSCSVNRVKELASETSVLCQSLQVQLLIYWTRCAGA